MKKKLMQSLALAACGALVIAWTNAGANEDGVENLVGKPFVKVEMKSIGGKNITNKDFKDKVVLIDFWATWCGPCKKASPVMEKLHGEFSKKGLFVIGANTFEEEANGNAAKGYQKEHKYTYTFTYDNDKLTESLGIKGIPTFILIGRDGKVAKTFVGFAPQMEQEMRKEITRLLAK